MLKIMFLSFFKNHWQVIHFSKICDEPSSTGEMAEPTRRREHDEGNINVTEDGELVCLLDEAIPTL